MFRLLKALALHPNSILAAKVASLFFVGVVLLLSRLPRDSVAAIEAKGWSQVRLIMLGAIFAFATQVYAAVADRFSRRTLPLKALDALCKEAYRICCSPRPYNVNIRITAYFSKLTLSGRRLVSVSRYVHGAGATESSIKFRVGEGTVGMAYASNVVITEEGFPDPFISRDQYVEEVSRRCKVNREKIEKMHVRSRSFLSIPIRYCDDLSSAVAVISVDSTNPALFANARRTRVIQLVDATRFLFHKNM